MKRSFAPCLVVLLVCFCGVLYAQRTTLVAGKLKDNLPATEVMVDDLLAVEVAPDGDLIILQAPYRGLIRRVDAVTGLISTIAGGGSKDRDESGVPATDAQFNGEDIAVDATGNIYLSDGFRIKKIDAVTGILTRIGGKDIGNSGDGGPAIDALIGNQVEDLHVFGNNLYLCDYVNRVIRKIDLVTGIISTVAGNGSDTYSGDGGLATEAGIGAPRMTTDDDGNIYLCEYFLGSVRKIDINTGIITRVAGGHEFGPKGDGGPAVDARLQAPYNVIVIDNSLYINEARAAIRKVDLTTGIITTFGGSGFGGRTGGDGGPVADADFEIWDFANDADGNLYITDRLGMRVRKVSNGIINTVAGLGSFGGDGGPAIDAVIQKPDGVVVLSNDDLVFVDGANKRIRKIDHTTGIITTIAGNGSTTYPGDGAVATSAGMEPKGLAVDEDDNLYVTTRASIRKIDATTGIITTIAGTGVQGFSGDGGQATSAKINAFNHIEYRNGNIYVAEYFSNRVRKIDLTTGIITTVAGNGNAGSDGDDGPATSASLDAPQDMAVNENGDIFIVVSGAIRKVDGNTGIISTIVPYGYWFTAEISPNGNILLGGEFGMNEFNENGEPLFTYLGPLDPSSQVNSIAFRSDGQLYFSDTYNSKLWKAIPRTAQTITLDLPASIKVGETLNFGPPKVTSSSGLPVNVSLYWDVDDAATFEDNILTAKKTSTVYLFADQPGNIDYISKTVSYIFTIEKGDQAITFNAPPNKTLGDVPFSPGATASSGLDVTYTSTSDKVSIAENIITLSKAGRVTITAHQDGNEDYKAATSVDANFCINPGQPVISASSAGATITLTSSADTGNQWYLDNKPITSATGKTYLANAEGVYSVTVTVDDCASVSSAPYTAVITGDINDLSEITLYPNPADTHIYYKTADVNAEGSIYGVDGRKVNLAPTQTRDMLIFYVKDLSPGTYFLKVTDNGKLSTIPWIKM